jgi:hypothetical protein
MAKLRNKRPFEVVFACPICLLAPTNYGYQYRRTKERSLADVLASYLDLYVAIH